MSALTRFMLFAASGPAFIVSATIIHRFLMRSVARHRAADVAKLAAAVMCMGILFAIPFWALAPLWHRLPAGANVIPAVQGIVRDACATAASGASAARVMADMQLATFGDVAPGIVSSSLICLVTFLTGMLAAEVAMVKNSRLGLRRRDYNGHRATAEVAANPVRPGSPEERTRWAAEEYLALNVLHLACALGERVRVGLRPSLHDALHGRFGDRCMYEQARARGVELRRPSHEGRFMAFAGSDEPLWEGPMPLAMRIRLRVRMPDATFAFRMFTSSFGEDERERRALAPADLARARRIWPALSRGVIGWDGAVDELVEAERASIRRICKRRGRDPEGFWDSSPVPADLFRYARPEKTTLDAVFGIYAALGYAWKGTPGGTPMSSMALLSINANSREVCLSPSQWWRHRRDGLFWLDALQSEWGADGVLDALAAGVPRDDVLVGMDIGGYAGAYADPFF